jgi:hypothetical protein
MSVDFGHPQIGDDNLIPRSFERGVGLRTI